MTSKLVLELAYLGALDTVSRPHHLVNHAAGKQDSTRAWWGQELGREEEVCQWHQRCTSFKCDSVWVNTVKWRGSGEVGAQ